MSEVTDFMIPVRLRREKQTAISSQTIVTLSSITIPNADSDRVILSIQGRQQTTDAYIVDSSTQITLSEAMEGGEIIEVIVPSFK